jgi:hypothetical protein
VKTEVPDHLSFVGVDVNASGWSAPLPIFCSGDRDRCWCAVCCARRRILYEHAPTLPPAAPETERQVVEVALVCPTCRRGFGAVRVTATIAPGSIIEAVPVCAGCRLEGR